MKARPTSSQSQPDVQPAHLPNNNRTRLGMSIIIGISLILLCDYYAFPSDMVKKSSVSGTLILDV